MYALEIGWKKNNVVCTVTVTVKNIKKTRKFQMASLLFTHPKMISALKNNKWRLKVRCTKTATLNTCKEQYYKQPMVIDMREKENVLVFIFFLSVFHKRWFAHEVLWLVLVLFVPLLLLVIYYIFHCMCLTPPFVFATCAVSTSAVLFQCADHFEMGKSGRCLLKFSKTFNTVTITVQSPLFLLTLISNAYF